jgi:hypothetical protein
MNNIFHLKIGNHIRRIPGGMSGGPDRVEVAIHPFTPPNGQYGNVCLIVHQNPEYAQFSNGLSEPEVLDFAQNVCDSWNRSQSTYKEEPGAPTLFTNTEGLNGGSPPAVQALSHLLMLKVQEKYAEALLAPATGPGLRSLNAGEVGETAARRNARGYARKDIGRMWPLLEETLQELGLEITEIQP